MEEKNSCVVWNYSCCCCYYCCCCCCCCWVCLEP